MPEVAKRPQPEIKNWRRWESYGVPTVFCEVCHRHATFAECKWACPGCGHYILATCLESLYFESIPAGPVPQCQEHRCDLTWTGDLLDSLGGKPLYRWLDKWCPLILVLAIIGLVIVSHVTYDPAHDYKHVSETRP